MILKRILVSVLALLFISACYTQQKSTNVGLPSIRNNVCKTLQGNVVIYAIFVDSKYTKPWSEHDIFTTLDSIQTAINWIEAQATRDSVYVNIDLEYHATLEGKIPIVSNLTRKSLSATLLKRPLYSGVKDIYRWADKIAAKAGKSLPEDTSGVTNMKNTLKDRERLIARLRDIYKTDKVALMYFINNYYTDEISLTFDISQDNEIEFSVVSFKEPTVIAHEFLHLFGALDLYITPFDKKRKNKKKKELAMELFPNEIMAHTHRSLKSLEINDFTKYLIGWEKNLDEEYQELLFGKKFHTIHY